MQSVRGAVAIATGAQASSLAIIRRRDNGATGTVALQSYPVATARGTDLTLKLAHDTMVIFAGSPRKAGFPRRRRHSNFLSNLSLES